MDLHEHEVWVAHGDGTILQGRLTVPERPRAVVVIGQADGHDDAYTPILSGVLNGAGVTTLLVDLLGDEAHDPHRRLPTSQDVELMARRLVNTSRWLPQLQLTRGLAVGYAGTGTAASAALVAAGREPHRIGAVVVRGGRFDLVDEEQLSSVWAPTLVLAQPGDRGVANRQAMEGMTTEKRLEIIPAGDTPFEQGGLLEYMALLSRDWFLRHLAVAEQPWGATA